MMPQQPAPAWFVIPVSTAIVLWKCLRYRVARACRKTRDGAAK